MATPLSRHLSTWRDRLTVGRTDRTVCSTQIVSGRNEGVIVGEASGSCVALWTPVDGGWILSDPIIVDNIGWSTEEEFGAQVGFLFKATTASSAALISASCSPPGVGKRLRSDSLGTRKQSPVLQVRARNRYALVRCDSRFHGVRFRA